MQSDIDYVVETTKRVLFSSNKKDEINRTEGIFSNKNTCFTWDAYLRVSEPFFLPFLSFFFLKFVYLFFFFTTTHYSTYINLLTIISSR